MKHIFKRKEEKFVLPLSVADEIQGIAKADLQFSEYNNGGELIDIRTTYLENDDFLIYHSKKSRMEKRYKIRIREYGKNGLYEKMVWVELKEKVYGQGYKSRFKINRKYIDDFIKGENIFPYVLLDNPGIGRDYLTSLYDRIQGLIVERDFYPRLVMKYQRLALQGKNSQGVRLTFDYNLQGGVMGHNDSLFTIPLEPLGYDGNRSIVELKIGNVYPEKAREIKEKYTLKKQNFSKYIFGLESFYNSFNQNSENLDKEYIPISEIAVYDEEYAI